MTDCSPDSPAFFFSILYPGPISLCASVDHSAVLSKYVNTMNTMQGDPKHLLLAFLSFRHLTSQTDGIMHHYYSQAKSEMKCCSLS